MEAITIAKKLSREMANMRFTDPVKFVYNPLEYAWPVHQEYLEHYGQGPKEVLLLGMNPGPFGMAQTGVPFGDVTKVKDFLKLQGAVGKPKLEHPKKPVLGFQCKRKEVSGMRLWGWVEQQFKTPSRFFARFFVHNYCPLLFLDEKGANLTPDKIPNAQMKEVLEACDAALHQLVRTLQVQQVVGVGGFAEKRARVALERLPVTFGRIMHPSPANPQANRDWAKRATQELTALGVDLSSI